MKIKKIILSIVIAIILISVDIAIFINRNTSVMYFLIALIIIASTLPYVIAISIENKRHREKEARFLDFVRDLVESIKSGTPINIAISNIKNRDYGALSFHVQKLANQLSLGIPLTTGLINFANDTRSQVISRSVGLMSEAERSGGEIEDILGSIAGSVNQIEQLKKQQKSSVYSLIVQGYIIFIVFIAIVLVLQYYLLPMTKGIGGEGMEDMGDTIKIKESGDMGESLFYLLVIQSLFTGIVIGKISEGNFSSGIKHSFILVSITLIISLGIKIFFKA